IRVFHVTEFRRVLFRSIPGPNLGPRRSDWSASGSQQNILSISIGSRPRTALPVCFSVGLILIAFLTACPSPADFRSKSGRDRTRSEERGVGYAEEGRGG